MRALFWKFLMTLALMSLTTALDVGIHPKKLGEIFRVLTAPDQLGTCHSLPLDKSTITSEMKRNPIFDADRAFDDRSSNVLNNMWYQAYVMIVQTRLTLETDKIHLELAKLTQAFFGIMPESYHPIENIMTGEIEEAPLTPVGIYAEKLRKIRMWYWWMHHFMETEVPDESTKPRVFCDGSYLKLQRSSAIAKDRDGRNIVDENGQGITILEWEARHGRSAHSGWFFWYDLPDERGYLVLGRDVDRPIDNTLPPDEQIPWELDPSTGEPNPCMRQGLEAVILGPNYRPPNLKGVGSWAVSRHMILCPEGLVAHTSDDGLDPKPEKTDDSIAGKGWGLVNNRVAGVLLAHEIVHLVYPFDSADYWPHLPKRIPDNDPNGQIAPEFPNMKTGFSRTRVTSQLYGPMQAMTLALYELAHPETENMEQLESLKTPEVYAWFARTLWLTVFTKQDWSTGLCRPWGSAPSLPLAHISGKRGLDNITLDDATFYKGGIRFVNIFALDQVDEREEQINDEL